MEKNEMNKKKVIQFIVITYLISWTIQIIVSILSLKASDPLKGNSIFTIGLSATMFIPMLVTLIVNHNLKGMGWKPRFKGNIRWIIFAVLSFFPITVIGAALFFAVFPDLFDMSGSYLDATYASYGISFTELLKEQGVSYNTYVLLMTAATLFEAPFVNMFVALGEEVGWRGFLYPELKLGFGRVKSWIIGGIVWAAFHFPCMIIAGYEYGTEYPGFPWLGLIVFTASCIAMGIIHEIVYAETGSIWFTALLHGAINAIAKLPIVFMNGNEIDKLQKNQIFGPFPNGIIGMIPMVIFAIVLGAWAIRKDRKEG